MFNIKNILAVLLTGVVFAFSGSVAYAATDPFSEACSQPGANQSEVCQNEARGGSSNPLFGSGSLLETVINLIALIAGVAAVIVIIVAGFQFVTAAGDSAKIKNARNAIIYAIIGLVVIALARVIIGFVLTRL